MKNLCNICKAQKQGFTIYTVSSGRNLLKTRSLWLNLFCSKKRSAAEEKIPEALLHSLLPVLCPFLFIEKH